MVYDEWIHFHKYLAGIIRLSPTFQITPRSGLKVPRGVCVPVRYIFLMADAQVASQGIKLNQ